MVNADITLYAKWNKQQSGGSGSGNEGGSENEGGSGSGSASTDKDTTGSQSKGNKKGTKVDLPVRVTAPCSSWVLHFAWA